ncbi:UNVERIFIED_CONTAM: L-type lectin-domain containing receptor kinase S.6 [Sesamum latifolium]
MGFGATELSVKGLQLRSIKGLFPQVAIKRFDRAGIDCTRNPFITEFATMVGCLRYKNLVQLEGGMASPLMVDDTDDA